MGLLASSSGYTPSKSSGGGSPSLDDLLKARGFDPSMAQPQEDEEGGASVGGWFSNVIGDITEFGKGLAGLAKMGIGDAYNAGADIMEEIIPGGQDQDRTYNSPEFLKEAIFDPEKFGKGDFAEAILPGLQTYAKKAYGINPLGGDFLPDLAKVRHSLYEDPVNVGLDVWGAGTLAGGAAKLGAKTAARGPSIGSALGKYSSLDDLARAAEAGELGAKGALNVRKILGEGEMDTLLEVGGKPQIRKVQLSQNPVRRKAQKGLNSLMSRKVSTLEDSLTSDAQLLGALDDAGGIVPARLQGQGIAANIQEKARLLEAARDLGVSRITRPSISKRLVKKTASDILSGGSGIFYMKRDIDKQNLEHLFESTLDNDQVARFHKTSQIDLPQAITLDGRRLGLEDARSILDAPDAQQIPDVDGIRAKFDSLTEYTTKVRQELDATPEMQEFAAQGRVGRIEHPLQDELDAASAYGDDLAEVLGLEVKRLRGEPIDPEAAAVAQTRLLWHDLQHEAVSKGYIQGGYRGVMQRRYGARLVEEHKNSPDFALDKFDVDQIAQDNPSYWKRFRDEDIHNDRQTPVYYPHLDPRKFKASEFTAKRGSVGMANMAGSAPYKHNTYWNYLNEVIETDPVEAYARRATHMRRIAATHDMVRGIAETFGRKIDNVDELSPGEAVWNPKSLKHPYRVKAEMDEAIAEAKMAGKSDADALTDGMQGALSKLADIDPKKLNIEDAVRGMAGEATEAELYAIPKVVADYLNEFSKHQTGIKAKIFVEAPTDVWRTAILAFSPRWIVNNLLGNVTFLKMQGGKLSDVLRFAGSPKFRKKVNDVIASLPEEARAHLGSGMISELQSRPTHWGKAGETKIGKAVARGRETKISKGFTKASVFSRHINEVMEQAFRKASFLKAVDKQLARKNIKVAGNSFWRSHRSLEKLAKEGLDDAGVTRSIGEVNHFFNDYKALGPFERHVVRKFLMPFYSFYKHVAKLTLSYPLTNPIKAGLIREMGQLAGEMGKDFEMLPDWLQNSAFVGPAGGGEEMFVNTRGANPLDAFISTIEDPGAATSMLHPFIQGAYGAVKGEDPLTGRPYTAPNAFTPFGSTDQYAPVYDEQGNIISMEPTTVRPGIMESVLGSVPQFDLARDAISMIPGVGKEGVGQRYSTGEEIVEGGENKYPRSVLQELGQLMGVSTTSFDVDMYEQIEKEKQRLALIKALRAGGLLPT